MNDEKLTQAGNIIDRALWKHKPSHIYLMLSGGNDSMSTTHFAAQYIAARYPKLKFRVLHVNTGIGIPQTREHVYMVCKLYGWELTEIRAKEDCGEDYEKLVLEFGFPGPSHHTKMYNRLKERCLEKLLRDTGGRRGGRVMLVTGLRQQESRRRMRLKPEPIQRQSRKVWCAPFFFLDKDELLAYRTQNNIPESEVSKNICMSGECLCGAFAEEGELKEIEFFYPETGKRLRDLERRVRAAGFPWGWDQGPPEWWGPMQEAKKTGQSDAFEREQKEEIARLCSSCEFRRERRKKAA